MTVNLTAEAMTRPEELTLKESLAWDYLQINCGSWFAVETGDGSIILLDESCDLMNATTLPDFYAFREFLGQVSDDHLSSDAAGFITSALHVPKSLMTPEVLDAMVSVLYSEEKNCDPSPDKAPESAPPKETAPEPLRDYYATFKVEGRYTVCVEASGPSAAKAAAQELYDSEDSDFNEMEYVGAKLISIQDERGEIILDFEK